MRVFIWVINFNVSSFIIKWCKININNQYKNLLLYPRHEKQLFSGKFSVLIDDLEETIKEWNKHGGKVSTILLLLIQLSNLKN